MDPTRVYVPVDIRVMVKIVQVNVYSITWCCSAQMVSYDFLLLLLSSLWRVCSKLTTPNVACVWGVSRYTFVLSVVCSVQDKSGFSGQKPERAGSLTRHTEVCTDLLKIFCGPGALRVIWETVIFTIFCGINGY